MWSECSCVSKIPVYATPGTIRGVREYKKLGEIPDGLFHEIDVDQKFTLGDLSVEAFAISHDANEPSGYRIEQGGQSVAVATDLGIYDDIPCQSYKIWMRFF